jgi:phosphate butyryltransferase
MEIDKIVAAVDALSAQREKLDGARKYLERLWKGCTAELDGLWAQGGAERLEGVPLTEKKTRSSAGQGKHPRDETDERRLMEAKLETLAALKRELIPSHGDPDIDRVLAGITSFILQGERRQEAGARPVLYRLTGPQIAERAEVEGRRFLIINPHLRVTNVACYEGMQKLDEEILHVSPDEPDTWETRSLDIEKWLSAVGVSPHSLCGIACRGGFMRPVPAGTYRVVEEMVRDMENPRIEHHSNGGIVIARKMAELTGRENEVLLTVTDPVVCDEIDLVERLTGFTQIKRDGTAAHYLNHRAVARLIASVLEKTPASLNLVTAHLGAGISIAAHRDGRIRAIEDAYSGVPSTNRSGGLDIVRVLEGLDANTFTFQDLEAAVYRRGGLLSLAGTDDFRTLLGFSKRGANERQCKKIELLVDFLARRVAGAVLRLTDDGRGGYWVALTGSLSRAKQLRNRIRQNLGDRFPLVEMPGNVENDALAAGLIRGYYEPQSLRDYPEARDRLEARRRREDAFIETPIFQRKLYYKQKGAPILSLDELIDATYFLVKERFPPTVAIVGAENEEAILAAKRANEEGQYRIAKFVLLGDYTAINQMAYDFDLVIDGDNYRIVDTDDPVAEATAMMEQGQVHVLMKGRLKTAEILRGVFKYLKGSGRLQKGQLISHVVVMDIPMRKKLLLVTDAAVNPYPDEEKKIAIVDNALKVARELNIPQPKVAVISAIEAVNPSVESSIEADRIAERLADRDDCLVEGPLSFDVAMDPDIAVEKRYKGAIKGTADIVLMPDIDAGNVLYKTLTTQSGATCAGVILAGDMPMVLTSRGDSARSKLASISLAVKLMFGLSDVAAGAQKSKQ